MHAHACRRARSHAQGDEKFKSHALFRKLSFESHSCLGMPFLASFFGFPISISLLFLSDFVTSILIDLALVLSVRRIVPSAEDQEWLRHWSTYSTGSSCRRQVHRAFISPIPVFFSFFPYFVVLLSLCVCACVCAYASASDIWSMMCCVDASVRLCVSRSRSFFAMYVFPSRGKSMKESSVTCPA